MNHLKLYLSETYFVRHHECRVKGFDGPEQFPGHVRNTSLGLSTASGEGERNLNILGVTNCAFFQQNSSSLLLLLFVFYVVHDDDYCYYLLFGVFDVVHDDCYCLMYLL